MAISLAFMTILTFIQVVLREFGTGWVWSLEATTYAFAWMVLIGMSYGVRTQAHIAIDLVSNSCRAARGGSWRLCACCFASSTAASCSTAAACSSTDS